MNVPESANKAGGYWRAIGNDPERASPQAENRWKCAVLSVNAFLPEFTQEQVARFLDSQYGAHFADEVQSYLRLDIYPNGSHETALRKAIWKWSDTRNTDIRLKALITKVCGEAQQVAP